MVQLNAQINKLRDPKSRTFTRGNIMPLSSGSTTLDREMQVSKPLETARRLLVNSVAHANVQKARHSSIRFAQPARPDFIAVPSAKEQTGKMAIERSARRLSPNLRTHMV